MFIERLSLTNFRCFGPDVLAIDLTSGLTAFVGVNGAGKTAVMQALQRLFGITGDHRRLRRQDFHVPAAELVAPLQRTFVLEAVLAFPELDAGGANAAAVPEFFQQMAADEAGRLKCRLRLEATWTDDGSLEGTIEQKYWAVRAFGPFVEADCIELKALDRARIQMIYVPASRDGASQVTAFLRGRLWRAINWSQGVRDTFADAGATLNGSFANEAAVDIVSAAVRRRWQEVHTAGTDATPLFRPVDLRFQEFIRKVEDHGARPTTILAATRARRPRTQRMARPAPRRFNMHRRWSRRGKDRIPCAASRLSPRDRVMPSALSRPGNLLQRRCGEQSCCSRAKALSARTGKPLYVTHLRRLHQKLGRSIPERDTRRLAADPAIRRRVSGVPSGRRFPRPLPPQCAGAMASRNRGA